MAHTTITSTELQTRAGKYLDEAGEVPVYITRPDRPDRVLVDASEYERLKRFDTRQTWYPEELPDHIKAAFERGYEGQDEAAGADPAAK